MDELMKDHCYVTSFNNFISDHKSIVARIGSSENKLTDEIKERILFDQESHLKAKLNSQQGEHNLPFIHERHISASHTGHNARKLPQTEKLFTRRIINPDMATCWLNSCLQLILTAMDYEEYSAMIFNSELGQELLKLQSKSKSEILDPSFLKDILITAEDIRVATRLSEISYQIFDKQQIGEHSNRIKSSRLDLRNGQQCVRDFFLCLNENVVHWPDVFSTFSFNITHSSECSTCKYKHQFQTNQLYVELPVPPNRSVLKNNVEEFFNERSEFGSYCEEGCKTLSVKSKWSSITSVEETKFLIVILTRGMETMDGYQLIKNEIKSTETLHIRYNLGKILIKLPFPISEIQLTKFANMKPFP